MAVDLVILSSKDFQYYPIALQEQTYHRQTANIKFSFIIHALTF